MPDKPYQQRVEEMRALVGNNAQRHDFRKALELVNTESKLGMDEADLRMLSLYYSELGKTTRFAEEAHLAEPYHSNSATHSLFSVLRMDETIRQAVAHYGAKDDLEMRKTRRRTGRCILMHDCGEGFGEVASMAQIVKYPERRKDIPEIERMVTDYMLKSVALCAVDGRDEASFHNSVDALRSKFDVIRKSGNIPTTEQFQRILDTEPLPALSRKAEKYARKWLRHYDMAEYQDTFTTHFVKNCEHVQGTRHLLRFGEVDAAPLKEASSKRVLANPKYTENNLGHMCHKAQTKNEQALARSMRDIIYETMAEVADRARRYIQRPKPPGNPHGGSQKWSHTQHAPHRRVNGIPRASDTGEMLYDTETNVRVAQLYRHAIKVDYLPKPKEVLVLTKHLPPELKGFAALQKAAMAR